MVGAAGASFSELNYLPAATLSNTTVMYFDGGSQLWGYSNGVQTQLSATVAGVTGECFTHDGHILLALVDGSTGYVQIYECYYDGSGLTRITSNAENHISVSAAPNNSAILYSNGTTLKTVNFSGGNVQTLGPGEYGVFSPDGTKIALLNSNGQPYLMAATPGAPQTAFMSELVGNNTVDGALSWSADGSKLAFGDGYCYVCDSANNGNYTLVAGGSGYDLQATIAPNGTTIAIARSSAAGVADSIITCGLDGNNPTTIASPSTGFSYVNPIWSPYLGPRSFVGSGGSLSTTSSGFLWSEKGSGFCSLASFMASTPADATITSETPSGGSASAVFDLHADKITSLKYTNGYYLPAIAISPNVSDSLISFDATTGFVTTVAPFEVTKNSPKPNRKVIGMVATYTGRFPAIYNSKGTNLTPNGATQVSLDLRSGKLISYQ